MNCKEANQLDIVKVLATLDYHPVSHSGSEYQYLAHYRNDKKPSLSVNRAKGLWYDHGSQERGTLLDLVIKILNTNEVADALNYCNGLTDDEISFSFRKPINKGLQKEKIKAYSILKSIKTIEDNSLINYLRNARGLSEATWRPYLEEITYQNTHGRFFAIGFKNDSGGYVIRNGLMSSPHFLGKADITTFKGAVNQLIMFEGFMDFLSYIELKKWKAENIIILNSTALINSGIKKAKDMFPGIKIKSFFDNDEAGRKATQLLKSSVPNVSDCSNEYSNHNDLNDYTIYLNKKLNRGL